jgi:thiamine-monophosphate kinase
MSCARLASNMGERARIARYFAPLAAAEAGSFSLTDDAAVLAPPDGQQLVITTDSVIEAIHVLPGATPQQFAQKLMRRNLSDLAAMGANPWRYTLNLHTPTKLPTSWFADFAATLQQEQERFGLTLVGGDSTSGGDAIHCTMTCFGLLDGAALRRNGATKGDDIYVSGTIGGAAYALHLLQQNAAVNDGLSAYYHCPEPRLQLGQMLRGIATSVIDISDGLLADIAQICAVSGCGAHIERDSIPLQSELQQAAKQNATAWRFALSGGDDYELCFTASASERAAIQDIATKLGLPLNRIGSITDGCAVILRDAHGHTIPVSHTGFEHT